MPNEDGLYTKDELDEVVTGLKAKNNELLGSQKDLKGKLAKYDDVDPARLAELEQAEKDRETASLKRKGEFDTLQKRRDEEHAAQLTAKDVELKKRDVVIEDALVGQAVIRAITEAEGNPLLIEHAIRSQVRLEDGQAVVVDVEGKRRLVGADHMTIPQLVDEFKQNDAYAGAFAGTGSRGSGTPTGTGRGKMPVGTVDANDPVAMGNNLQAIVDGTVVAKY